MNRAAILHLLEVEGFNHGRELIVGPERFGRYRPDDFIVRKAAIATASNRIFWRGDLDLTVEAEALSAVAREVGEDFYVLDERDANHNPRRFARLMMRATWWTCIRGEWQNEFLGMGRYAEWSSRRRHAHPKEEPGTNWTSVLAFRDASANHPEWQTTRLDPARCVRPVVMQFAGPFTLVWFENELPLLEPAFSRITTRIANPSFTTSEEASQLNVWEGDTLVAMVTPSPVPNRFVAEAGRRELALRRAASAGPEELRALVCDLLRPLQFQPGVKLSRAVSRLVQALEGRHDFTYPFSVDGITEWAACKAVSHTDEGFFFRRTRVPLHALFHELMQGRTVAEFLRMNPSVRSEQVGSVLEHLVSTFRV